MMEDMQHMGIRLAFRREGDFVNCYLAKKETMEHATLLASMRVTTMEAAGIWEDWKALMRRALEHHIKETIGVTPAWGDEERAPEHERAGRA